MKVVRLELIERDPWLVSICQGKTVLHLGCTDYPLTQSRIEENRILHQRLAAGAREIVGVDIDEPGIKELRRLMPGLEFIAFDAERLTECVQLAQRRFEVVMAADVLEHVCNAGAFLTGARSFLSPGGKLVLTTPSAFSVKRMVGLGLTGIEQVHPDHTAYFSISTLTRLLELQKLKVVDHYGFQWRNPTTRNRVANALTWPLLSLSGGRLCDELAVVAEAQD